MNIRIKTPICGCEEPDINWSIEEEKLVVACGKCGVKLTASGDMIEAIVELKTGPKELDPFFEKLEEEMKQNKSDSSQTPGLK